VLEALGISPAEEAVYDLLAGSSGMLLADILATGDAPQVQAAVDRLEAKGLIRRIAGPGHPYVVAPPDHAVEALIVEQMSALQVARTAAKELSARLRRVSPGQDPAELIEIVTGEGSARQLFAQAVQSARDEVAVFDCPPYVTDAETMTTRQAERMASSGIRFRTVFAEELLDDPYHVHRIIAGIRSGELARVGRVPLKLALIDREWGMLPLVHADGGTTEAVVIVRQSVLLDSLAALFESVWEQGSELKALGDELRRHGPAEIELRQIAELLAMGMTDSAIARSLDISERTVRRRITELLHELRAQSRFQAAVRAAARGWV
jgi:DNA-binding CsgD family transcriptional regulator/sugar-specific transcriptional regulator TrmB